ncbi:MAG: hypothetical protein LBV50_07955 [Novosphingobium sp.]|jgi:transposase|nr:hypothetical protein [Novosphingobium sp.]
MSLTDLEQHVYAYYIAHDAAQFSAAPRFYPHGELVLIFADKIQVATRKFGRQVHSRSKAAANALIDKLIAAGAYSTRQNEFGGSMHQFQEPAYKAFLKDEQARNPIILKAKGAGPGFWEQAFAAVTA